MLHPNSPNIILLPRNAADMNIHVYQRYIGMKRRRLNRFSYDYLYPWHLLYTQTHIIIGLSKRSPPKAEIYFSPPQKKSSLRRFFSGSFSFARTTQTSVCLSKPLSIWYETRTWFRIQIKRVRNRLLSSPRLGKENQLGLSFGPDYHHHQKHKTAASVLAAFFLFSPLSNENSV